MSPLFRVWLIIFRQAPSYLLASGEQLLILSFRIGRSNLRDMPPCSHALYICVGHFHFPRPRLSLPSFCSPPKALLHRLYLFCEARKLPMSLISQNTLIVIESHVSLFLPVQSKLIRSHQSIFSIHMSYPEKSPPRRSPTPTHPSHPDLTSSTIESREESRALRLR